MEQRKNILFVTNRVPFPPNKGDKIRTFHQLDHLSLGHRVYCACFADTPEDIEHAVTLKRWCADVALVPWNRRKAIWRSLPAWLAGSPLTTSCYRNDDLAERIAGWASEVSFDAAVAFSSSVASYVLNAPVKRRVLDLCDVDSQKWLDYAADSHGLGRFAYRREGRCLRAFEMECLQRFDAALVITDRERRILDPHRHCRHLHVVGNGVSLYNQRLSSPSRQGPTLSFVGAMDYRPNIQGICWFTKEVWPRIRQEMPHARLQIIGRRPVRKVANLASLSGVAVFSDVADPRDYLAKSRVVVAPLQIARGLQNKVLEAMALRRPVVATTAVASCLQVQPGRNIMVADDPAGFAERVIELCRFDELCDQIGEAGYRCAATYYSWAETLQKYERILLGLPLEVKPVREPEPESPDVASTAKPKIRAVPQLPPLRAPLATSVPTRCTVTGGQRRPRSPFAMMFRDKS